MPHVQLLWSRFRTTSASGVPSVRPWRRPASTSTSSVSICWRGERPYPCWRRRRSASIASFSSTSPAGSPETIATSAGPCDSPAVASSSVMKERLEPRKDPRDEAPLPVRCHREQKAAEPRRLVGIERDGCLGLFPVPDAETSVLRFRQIDRDAKPAVADLRVAAEVLDDLRALCPAAVRAEAELVLHAFPACPTTPHRARSMPSATSGQANGVAHHTHRRSEARPKREARRSLRHEHLESVENTRAGHG